MFVAPGVAKLTPKLSGWTLMQEVVKQFREIILEHVNRHRKEHIENENPKDFIDAYLKEIDSTTDPSSSFYKDAGSKSLRHYMVCLHHRVPLLDVLHVFAQNLQSSPLLLSWVIFSVLDQKQPQQPSHGSSFTLPNFQRSKRSSMRNLMK